MRLTDESIELTIAKGSAKQVIKFTELYSLHFPKIKAYILNNNGNTDDAKDVFQETLMVLIDKIKTPEFVLTSSLSTYLYAISRNIWLNKLKENGKITVCDSFEDISDLQEDKNDLIDNLLPLWITLITARCQQIIKSIFFLNEPMHNLANRMGWKNRHTADNQKYKCIQQLKKVSDK